MLYGSVAVQKCQAYLAVSDSCGMQKRKSAFECWAKEDGTIPERDREILEEIGDWRRVNGEAVYKSRPWKIVGEGKTRKPEGSFTDSEDGQVLIRSMGIPGAPNGEGVFFGRIRSVSILGSEEKPFWRQEKDGLHVRTCAVKSHLPVVAKVQVL